MDVLLQNASLNDHNIMKLHSGDSHMGVVAKSKVLLT